MPDQIFINIPVLTWRNIAEYELIVTYVPEADQMTRAEALELALQRDEEATKQLVQDYQSQLDLQAAVEVVRD
jgi:hypothetical protein